MTNLANRGMPGICSIFPNVSISVRVPGIPGIRNQGLFLVIFSNRMFPEKAVQVWRQASEEERFLLVEELFSRTGAFAASQTAVSKGHPRPRDDKYAHVLSESDPIYAVYAERLGGCASRVPRPQPTIGVTSAPRPEEVDRRAKRIRQTLRCPHCDSRLRKWAVPDNPFGQTWGNEYMWICFNDACPYYVRGWQHMFQHGNRSVSYCLMYNPETDRCMPIPVPSSNALREGIVEENTDHEVKSSE